MPLDWTQLCLALGSVLEYENRCQRLASLDENAVRAFAIRAMNDVCHVRGVVEQGTFGIPSARAVDIHVPGVGGALPDTLVEMKWVRSSGGARQWMREVFDDVLRLEVATGLAADAQRVLLLAGPVEDISSSVVGYRPALQRVPSAQRVRAGEHLIGVSDNRGRPRTLNHQTVSLRHLDPRLRAFVLGCVAARALSVADLPESYEVRLLGAHHIPKVRDSVRVLAVEVRPTGAARFQTTAWPPPPPAPPPPPP